VRVVMWLVQKRVLSTEASFWVSLGLIWFCYAILFLITIAIGHKDSWSVWLAIVCATGLTFDQSEAMRVERLKENHRLEVELLRARLRIAERKARQ